MDPEKAVFGIIIGAIALYVLGALASGSSSFLYSLANMNTTGNTQATVIELFGDLVIPIFFFLAVAYGLYNQMKT